MRKLYNSDRERKDARNKRERERRKNDETYSRYVALRNNHSLELAKEFIESKKCVICGFEREGHYNQLHHITTKKDNGEDVVENILELCYYCHKDIHNKSRGYEYLIKKYS